jgi:hypothetical protein
MPRLSTGCGQGVGHFKHTLQWWRAENGQTRCIMSRTTSVYGARFANRGLQLPRATLEGEEVAISSGIIIGFAMVLGVGARPCV